MLELSAKDFKTTLIKNASKSSTYSLETNEKWKTPAKKNKVQKKKNK